MYIYVLVPVQGSIRINLGANLKYAKPRLKDFFYIYIFFSRMIYDPYLMLTYIALVYCNA